MKKVNKTGYKDGAKTAKNEYNVIPGQDGYTPITMNGVSQPIYANGQYLQPNSGEYIFPGNFVYETKAQQGATVPYTPYSFSPNGQLIPDPYGEFDENGNFLQSQPQPINNNVVQDSQVNPPGQMQLNTQQTDLWNQPTVNDGYTPQPIEQQQTSSPNYGGWIQQGVQAVGGVLDTLGDIKRGFLKGAPAVLNALIPDNKPKRQTVPQVGYNRDAYGAQQYNNMFEDGGQIAQKGATIKVDSKRDPRYQAYQDSLNANKWSEKAIQQNLNNLNKEDGFKTIIGPKTAFKDTQYIQEGGSSYKNWPTDNYWGWGRNGDTAAFIPYYSKPTQEVVVRPPVDRISSMSIPNPEPNINMQPIAWDNITPSGVFPLYGNDNALIGTWDQQQGQTSFYPIQNNPVRSTPYTQDELRGLPPDTKIESGRRIQNVRRLQNGGQISAKKAQQLYASGRIDRDQYMSYIQPQTQQNMGTYDPPTVPQPIQQPTFAPGSYYSANPNGSFAINTQQIIADRTSNSGRIGADYDHYTNRAYGYEGLYGNKDYRSMYKDGGTLGEYEEADLTYEEIQRLRVQGYDIQF